MLIVRLEMIERVARGEVFHMLFLRYSFLSSLLPYSVHPFNNPPLPTSHAIQGSSSLSHHVSHCFAINYDGAHSLVETWR